MTDHLDDGFLDELGESNDLDSLLGPSGSGREADSEVIPHEPEVLGLELEDEEPEDDFLAELAETESLGALLQVDGIESSGHSATLEEQQDYDQELEQVFEEDPLEMMLQNEVLDALLHQEGVTADPSSKRKMLKLLTDSERLNALLRNLSDDESVPANSLEAAPVAEPPREASPQELQAASQGSDESAPTAPEAVSVGSYSVGTFLEGTVNWRNRRAPVTSTVSTAIDPVARARGEELISVTQSYGVTDFLGAVNWTNTAPKYAVSASASAVGDSGGSEPILDLDW